MTAGTTTAITIPSSCGGFRPGARRPWRSAAGPGPSRLLAQRAERVVALDLSPEMVRVARERSVRYPNIAFEVADVTSRPLPADRFDVIASIATLHHLPLGATLSGLSASLVPGGTLIVLDLY